MQKPQKDQLRRLVSSLRHTLQGAWETDGRFTPGDLDRELSRLGFQATGAITAIDALPSPTPAEVRAYRAAAARLEPLPNADRPQARAEIVERAAYSWINRLLGLRAMEARGLIPETLRANPDYQGISEALYVLRADQATRTAGPDGGWWAVLDDACATQALQLPGLFDPIDPHAALRPTAPALLACVQAIGSPALDAAFSDPDAIGWAYQFYQEEAKQRVYDKLAKGGKLETRSEIAAATQLFTEPYMVKWLLQNSLGRSYAEAYPNSQLPATWEYYIDRATVLAQANGEQDEPPAVIFKLDELTVMDPCMGSVHFLREAFDLLFAMYREQHPHMSAAAIAETVLKQHLHGIDIDPRAAQLAALTLVLRAWELIGGGQRPTLTLNLAATPTLAPGSLDRHLKRHPEDAPLRPVLEAVFAVLEQAPILGSLIQPEEQLGAALEQVRKASKGGQLGLLGGSAEGNRLIEELARTNPNELKRQLLERIERSFAREAQEGDAGAQLLGHEAGEGLHLLQLLDRKYAVVATNPPYMGSKNMDAPLRQYVERHYKPGKRDLYAAFILRCLELAKHGGRVAMITQQSWMFLKSFADLRALPQERVAAEKGRHEFTGLLRESAVESLAHLGEHAFEDAAAAGAFAAMFTLGKRVPGAAHRLVAYRLVSFGASEKAARLVQQCIPDKGGIQYEISTPYLLNVEQAPVLYWLNAGLLRALTTLETLSSICEPLEGMHTNDNPRFLRFRWEVGTSKTGARWIGYSKGGGYAKWSGLEQYFVEWDYSGARIKSTGLAIIPSQEYYGLLCLTYTDVARGSLGCRRLPAGEYFGDKGPGVFTEYVHVDGTQAFLNTRPVTGILRALSPSLQFRTGYVRRVPVPPDLDWHMLGLVGKASYALSARERSANLLEMQFDTHSSRANGLALDVCRLSIETMAEIESITRYGLSLAEQSNLYSETGTPAGRHPLIAGHDALPPLPADLDLPPLPQEVTDSLAQHERMQPTLAELKRIKANLRALYEAGPGAKAETEVEESDAAEDEETVVAGAYIPIPTETFLEELSVRMEIHPISVYWLLEELRSEGARCKPEEKRLLEDRLTVIILRLLGHRWPRQIESGEPLPTWADSDGIIPLTGGTRERVLAERVRDRLRAEGGDLAAQRDEALLNELTGRTLEEWLRRDFFKRHVSQFKRRPVAWQLASSPTAGGRKKGAEPAFECLVYYHRTDGDLLARLRTHYVERLLERERATLAAARQSKDETAQARAQSLIAELEDFARRLSAVEESGFACAELDTLIDKEPLDRWSGDGELAPTTRDALLGQERAWRVDINDGVRVNVAPLQAAGLLAQDVIAGKDVRKAIADRARWRSDERRWVRAGKLPRCGWMEEKVPESPAWTKLAPEREKERLRLEEKRAKALAGLQGGDDAGS